MLPEIYMIARLDGRGFTKLTKETHPYKKPFDLEFSNLMVETSKHLMNCGFHILYAYTQSDEISLLFHKKETAFSRKTRKYISILAGEASAKFSLLLGSPGVFDCRISQLPHRELVMDYFRWRSEDALRNSLNAYCYWNLREENKTATQAFDFVKGMSISNKNEFLFKRGINFNDLPLWLKRGIGIYWKTFEKKWINKDISKEVITKQRELIINQELPMKEKYLNLLNDIIPFT
ncbi:tRNA(His) guanylyltransferase Thg1 family protein [Apibacter muscae]|uniref:tRNA(His) guanylyltransferase Thg1 family protein n=1 Tax=Apibacter muscae TaxID=2509004 RepID=UPI002938F25F|nr:tRNA(His) guanylyltransferase Thg1 family protein [Apibacter muscae]